MMKLSRHWDPVRQRRVEHTQGQRECSRATFNTFSDAKAGFIFPCLILRMTRRVKSAGGSLPRSEKSTYMTAHWAKDRYSTRTSRPLFSSLRNSRTHLGRARARRGHCSPTPSMVFQNRRGQEDSTSFFTSTLAQLMDFIIINNWACTFPQNSLGKIKSIQGALTTWTASRVTPKWLTVCIVVLFY